MAVALLMLSLVATESVSASAYRSPVEEGVVAALTPERDLLLEAQPHLGEGMLGFALRFCGERAAMDRISRANGDFTRLLVGVSYRIPFSSLRPDWQLRVVRGTPPASWRQHPPQPCPARAAAPTPRRSDRSRR